MPAEVGSGARDEDDELMLVLDDDGAGSEEEDTDDGLVEEDDDTTLLEELRGLELETAPLPVVAGLLVPAVAPLPLVLALLVAAEEEDDELLLEVDDSGAEEELELEGDVEEEEVEATLLLDEEGVVGLVPQAGLKTHLQPPVQFSPSSSQVGGSQPRPQTGARYPLLLFNGSHSSKRDGLITPSPHVSSLQSRLQSLPPLRLPRSHCSPASTLELPQ